jgi:hypothetical protein
MNGSSSQKNCFVVDTTALAVSADEMEPQRNSHLLAVASAAADLLRDSAPTVDSMTSVAIQTIQVCCSLQNATVCDEIVCRFGIDSGWYSSSEYASVTGSCDTTDAG